MPFDLQLFETAKRLAGMDHEMNDHLQMYYSACTLLEDAGLSVEKRVEFSVIARVSESMIRKFVASQRNAGTRLGDGGRPA